MEAAKATKISNHGRQHTIPSGVIHRENIITGTLEKNGAVTIHVNV